MDDDYDAICTLLVGRSWVDWEVIFWHGNTLRIGGANSLSYGHEIILEFRNVDAYRGKAEWTTSTEPMIRRDPASEAESISIDLKITAPRTIYVMANSQFDDMRQVIAAESIHLIQPR